MGDPITMAVTSLAGGAEAGAFDFLKAPDAPELPGLPPPVEDVDVAGQEAYTKKRLKGRKGRRSTILSQMGSSNTGKKTVLG